jgi:hypothetical protein
MLILNRLMPLGKCSARLLVALGLAGVAVVAPLAPSAVAVPDGAGDAAVAGAVAGTSEARIDYEFQWQETGYWCGPAATRMALTGRGYFYSQGAIANALGTTTEGTSSVYEITRVLNDFGDTQFYETRMIPGTWATDEEIALLRSDVRYDIANGYPIVANVVGTAVDVDGNSHTYSGGHYLAVVGYRDDGNAVRIADSAVVGANPTGSYWMSTERLAHWIGLRGYSA